MRFPHAEGSVHVRALATDYDGTIARNGRIDREVRKALERLRAAGISIVLVTGRIYRDLQTVAGDLSLFDAVVAENGAILTFPRGGRSIRLAAPPPADFLLELRKGGFSFDTGECIVAMSASVAGEVDEIIRRRALPLVEIFNGESLMVLPEGTDKATGLRHAFAALRLDADHAIGIGDAQNDHVLLDACGIGVAVPWATPCLKARADIVLEGSWPDSIVDFIEGLE